ncbi:MAG: redoxin family protein [Acidobacteriia bacterium]|nr:redoxin family protein [Terriglobia bacterium]
MRGLCFLLLWAAAGAGSGTVNLEGKAVDPFAPAAKVRVFIFVRTDCPVSNRYAPELKRLSDDFAARGAVFSMVYADPGETSANIRRHIEQYGFPGVVIRDPAHSLVRRAKATITPEAAVFSTDGKLLYHGRIDNRFVELGKSMANPTRRDLEDSIAAALDGRPQSEESAPAVGCYLADVE